MRADLTNVILDARLEIRVLRDNGHDAQADTLDRFINAVQHAARPFLNWLTVEEAVLKSDHTDEWLRARFDGWEAEGLARWNGRKREYLDCVVPRRDLALRRGAA